MSAPDMAEARAKLRAALLTAGRATDAFLHDDVSDDFLAEIGDEVALFSQRMRRERNEAQDALTQAQVRIAELEGALRAVKHEGEYPDELGDIIDAALSPNPTEDE